MNTTELTSLLNSPNTITHLQCSDLESVLKEYPYFQSARSLYLKGLHIQDNFKYNTALKLTAAHTIDRTVLFDFITNKNFAQELDFTKNISVKDVFETINEINEIPTAVESITKEIELPEDIIDLDLPKEAEIQNSISDEEKLELSVLNSIIIANETTDNQTENIIIEESISLENPLEKSILSSITESSQSSNNIEIPTSPSNPSIRERISWLEDTIDLEQKQEIEIYLDKPIILDDNKTLSFQEWLLLSKTTPIERSENNIIIENQESVVRTVEENQIKDISTTTSSLTSKELEITEKTEKDINSKMDLIDKFIHNNPKISPPKDNIPVPNYITKKNDSPYLMTETLAKIYLEQKKYTKAIQAYEILILKYPEKSSLFADRILDIKDLQQNNNR
ncbi:tetratricopeptide repeat protein [Flavobacterium oreochromis]|uniref:Tetratricopeptide repeat protein n=2 Tax=Flavobacterium TaxID=237 RepID=A0A246GCW3_9FLAO|nr:tetratricopeptide repeat protein [Flavobacterium oreochromis]OWP77390.1 hypothetical protein BWG23_05440 [Flavobacterium oreochromis]OWP79164.1 hypothetical protein BWK62_03345 [Flavobacterium oreochromis]